MVAAGLVRVEGGVTARTPISRANAGKLQTIGDLLCE
jgi:hypothetical protein